MTMENQENNKNVEVAPYTLDIQMSSDYYSAHLILNIFEADVKITSKEVEKFLNDKNIENGIDYAMIEKIVKNPEEGKYLIAEGKKHVNGEDAKIIYNFDTDVDLHPEINEDGSVNFKKINLLKKVAKGALLATKKPLTEGEKGMTVTGKEIFPKKGKDKNFKIGKGVYLSEDGLKAYAEFDGSISYVNGKISVDEILELYDGVGVNTGNIEFPGKVLIHGTVDSGYTVKATEDIIVDGIVEGATLISEQNIEITKGIQGNDHAEVICSGGFKCGFVNNSRLKVGGDINVDIIMHSHVECNGQLTAQGKRGTVVGGDYVIKKGLTTKILGSEMGTLTNLKIGIDNKLLTDYKNAIEDQKNYGNEFRELIKNEKTVKKKIDQGNRNKLILMQYREILERMKVIKPILDQAKKDVKELRKKFSNLRGASVSANLIYPGVKLNITNTYYNVKQEIRNVKIVKQDGEIKILGS